MHCFTAPGHKSDWSAWVRQWHPFFPHPPTIERAMEVIYPTLLQLSFDYIVLGESHEHA